MYAKNKNERSEVQKMRIRLDEPEREALRGAIETSAVLAHRGHEIPIENQRKMSIVLHKQLRELMEQIAKSAGEAEPGLQEPTERVDAPYLWLLYDFLLPIKDAAGNFIRLPPDNWQAMEDQSCIIHVQIKNLGYVFELKENGVDFEAVEESTFASIDKIISEANLRLANRKYFDPLVGKPF